MSKAVAVTNKFLAQYPNPVELLQVPEIGDAFIASYESTSGRHDGPAKWEAEKVLIVSAMQANSALAKCDNFSFFNSLVELSVSGLTLRDGLSYLVPFGKKCTFMPGWKGRLEQINEIPTVIHVHQPQVVFDCDDYEKELGMKPRVIRHVTKTPRPADAQPVEAYLVVEFKHGTEVYFLDQEKAMVAKNYSPAYTRWIKAYNEFQRGNQLYRFDAATRSCFYSYQGTEYETKAPLWVTDLPEAFRKTIVKQTWKALPKTPKQKWLDEKQLERATALGVQDLDEELINNNDHPNFDALRVDEDGPVNAGNVPAMDDAEETF